MNRAFVIYFDGASKGNPGPAGIGGVILDDQGKLHEVKRFIGTATNNQAEYTALLDTLEQCKKLGAKVVQVFSDSELVVRQLNGEYQVKDPKLRVLYDQVRALRSAFERVSFQHVPREKNKHADALANEAVLGKKVNGREDWIVVSLDAPSAASLIQEFLETILKKRKPVSEDELDLSVVSLAEKFNQELSAGSPKAIRLRLHRDCRSFQMEW